RSPMASRSTPRYRRFGAARTEAKGMPRRERLHRRVKCKLSARARPCARRIRLPPSRRTSDVTIRMRSALDLAAQHREADGLGQMQVEAGVVRRGPILVTAVA